ncbi:ras-related protein Rab-28 [Leptinotarsa decemlineata]|uniref:ras-related protein Rab-28 n=1 Tax=Leptinotarsa decemlineata TaxID=7539 RepID=UPI003D30749E
MSDSEEEITEKQFKVVFLGDGNVGKTSLIRRFCYDEFSRHYSQTVGVDFYMKRLTLSKGKEVSIRIFDLGGIQVTGQMLKNYLFNANMIVLVYDITSSSSFDNLVSWLNIVKNAIDYPTEVVVYGNKNDSEHKRTVGLDRTKRFVAETQLVHFLVSAKTGENVSSCLTDLVARHSGVELSRFNGQKRPTMKQSSSISSPKERSQKITTTGQTDSAVCSLQ